MKKIEFSKKLINDIRLLLWIITISGILLAFMCVYMGYLGTLPWISALIGLPWSAHGIVCSFYLNMAKSDHKKGGITYDLALREAESVSIYDNQAEDFSALDDIPVDLNGPI